MGAGGAASSAELVVALLPEEPMHGGDDNGGAGHVLTEAIADELVDGLKEPDGYAEVDGAGGAVRSLFGRHRL